MLQAQHSNKSRMALSACALCIRIGKILMSLQLGITTFHFLCAKLFTKSSLDY